MAQKLINLWAEDNANIIDDDTTATLTLENSSTGAGVLGLNSSTGAGVYAKNTLTGPAIIAERTATAGPTISPVVAIQSIVSGCFFEFKGAFVSTASLLIGSQSGEKSDNTAFYIPVFHGSEKVKGYIPVIKGLI